MEPFNFPCYIFKETTSHLIWQKYALWFSSKHSFTSSHVDSLHFVSAGDVRNTCRRSRTKNKALSGKGWANFGREGSNTGKWRLYFHVIFFEFFKWIETLLPQFFYHNCYQCALYGLKQSTSTTDIPIFLITYLKHPLYTTYILNIRNRHLLKIYV